MRPALAAVFVLALASTVLAGDGLVLVPHAHAPGQPLDHPHGLALYRFPIALLGASPDVAPAERGAAPSFRLARPFGETLAGASLILLGATLAIAALRSAALLGAVVPRPPAGARQWWSITPTGPPRTSLLSV